MNQSPKLVSKGFSRASICQLFVLVTGKRIQRRNLEFVICYKKKKLDLFAFKAGTDVTELLVDTNPLHLFVLAVTYVADENGKTSHPRQRHESQLDLTKAEVDPQILPRDLRPIPLSLNKHRRRASWNKKWKIGLSTVDGFLELKMTT